MYEGVLLTDVIVSLTKDDFELRNSTGSGLFELFGRDFKQILGQIVGGVKEKKAHFRLTYVAQIKNVVAVTPY